MTIRTVEAPAWLLSPILAWRYGFDRCALEMDRDADPVAVFASTPFHARELARRIQAGMLLCPVGECGLAPAEFRDAIGPEVRPEYVHVADAGAPDLYGRPRAIIWAEPETATWQGVADQVAQLAASGTTLCVLGRTTQLHRRVPGRLRSLGFRVESCYGFHGPLSLALGMASRFPTQWGRDDLVDRCFAAMRQRLVVRGWQAGWSLVWMLAGRF